MYVVCMQASSFQLCIDTSKFVEQGVASSLFGGFMETSCLVPDKDSDAGEGSILANDHSKGQSQHSSITDTLQVLPRVAPRELHSHERETAISRYKEKRKTRRYLYSSIVFYAVMLVILCYLFLLSPLFA